MPAINQFHTPSVLQQVETTLLKVLPDINKVLEAQQYLDMHGASVETACSVVANIMNFSERDGLKLKAAQTVLELQGALAKESHGEVKIHFNFSSDSVQVANILQPVR